MRVSRGEKAGRYFALVFEPIVATGGEETSEFVVLLLQFVQSTTDVSHLDDGHV